MYLNAMDSIPCYLLRIKISVKETQVNEESLSIKQCTTSALNFNTWKTAIY